MKQVTEQEFLKYKEQILKGLIGTVDNPSWTKIEDVVPITELNPGKRKIITDLMLEHGLLVSPDRFSLFRITQDGIDEYYRMPALAFDTLNK